MANPITRRSTTPVRFLAALAAAAVLVGMWGLSPADAAPATAHAAPPVSTRTMRVAVVLLRLPGSSAEPVSRATMQATMFGATKSVANWFSQMSGGQVAVTGEVFGYYAGVSSCDLATQLSAAAAAATKFGFVAANYDNLVVYTPNQACGFSGMGWIGARGIFLSGDASQGVIEHEIGHNLGLLHAGEYACGVAALSAGCLIDYGDPTDVMGDQTLNRGFSAEHKYMLGWIPASEVRTVTSGTQTIALTASENPLVAGSTELIHVRAADGTLFAIDRRASLGYDAGIAGVWIRQVAPVSTDDTELLRSSALPAGHAFTSAAHGITIETLTDSGKTASVRVCVGTCTGSVSSQAAGTITARNIVTGSKTSRSNGSLTLTIPAGHGVGAGHTVIVSTYASRFGGSVACLDSRGNTYAVNVNSLGTQRLIVCSARAKAGLPPGSTITIRYPMFNGSTVSSANDLSGIRAVARAEATSSRGAGTAAVSSGAAARTRDSREIVFGVLIHRGTPKFTPTSGYRSIGAVSYLSGNAQLTINPEYKVVSAVGAFELRGTLTSAQQWRAAVVTFFRG